MKSIDDFYVNTLEIGGLGAALSALRLPFGLERRSIVGFNIDDNRDDIKYTSKIVKDFNLNKDVNLISTLIKRGDEHSKVLRGIVVWCEINAPRYWWVEMDTYKVGAERLSSESTMHIQCKGLSTKDLIKTKEELLEGTMQKRIWMFSYQTLRRIYKQRYNHRLPQWHIFCDWVKTLPFAEELILTGLENEED